MRRAPVWAIILFVPQYCNCNVRRRNDIDEMMMMTMKKTMMMMMEPNEE